MCACCCSRPARWTATCRSTCPRRLPIPMANPQIRLAVSIGARAGHGRAPHPLSARASVIGGSSSINGMVYVRGHALDYDGWAARDGLHDWSYGHCLPYFRKAETRAAGGDDYRGDAGPLHVRTGTCRNPLYGAFIAAGQASRLPRHRRHERLPAGRPGADGHDGAPRPALEHGDGLSAPGTAAPQPAVAQRCVGTAHRLRRPARRAPRRRCRSGASTANCRRLRARREVILCGGAINSPQLLQLSGIGNADELSAAAASTSSRRCLASARTCRITSKPTSSTPASSRSPCTRRWARWPS